LADDPSPAHIAGYGPIPAGVARDLVRDTKAEVWVRRLYASLADGSLVTMESRRRWSDGQLRRLIVLRDQFCRTPWCDAPIRHARPAAEGGETSGVNRDGLCVSCNHAKQAPGWSALSDSGAGPAHPDDHDSDRGDLTESRTRSTGAWSSRQA